MATTVHELVIDGVDQSSYRSTVLHFLGTGVVDTDTVASTESLIAGWRAALENLWLGSLPASYFLMQYRARRNAFKPSYVAHSKFQYGQLAGTRSGTSTSQNLCPVLFLIPQMGFKSGGKIFWPSVLTSDYVQNAPAAGWKTAVLSFVTAALAGFTNAGITWSWVVFSRKHGTYSQVTQTGFSPVIGYQGRRRTPTGAV